MELEPNDLLLFARVVDEGSFSRAGERLGVPKSTVSRRVAALEVKLGERLLLRTTRKLKVTDFGLSVLAHARQIADEVDAAGALAQHRQAEPSGRLRVSMPADLAQDALVARLARFVAEHPAIELELDLSARRVDLIGENFDLAIRMGDLPDDASLAARRIAVFAYGLYASPAYLAGRGTPESPADLARHDALLLRGRGGDAIAWQLARAGGEAWRGALAPKRRVVANAPELLIRLAVLGTGIAGVPRHYAVPHVERGTLVPVLADWALPPAPAWAVFPGRRLMPARTRVFLDTLADEFSDARCQAVLERDERAHRRAPLQNL